MRSSLAAAALALAATTSPAGAAHDEPATAGPRDVTAPPGAIFAEDAAALRAMVADPTGPRDIWLRAAVYGGDLTVRRTVAIRGVKGSVLEGSGTATVVNLDADDVTLENVIIRRSGHRHTAEDSAIKAKGDRVRIADVRTEDTLFGISLGLCHRCVLERAHVIGYGDDTELRGDGIKLWEANDSVVKDCVVEHTRDVVVWYTRRALLENNVVTRSRYGTHFMYAHDSTVRGSHVEGNVVGIFVMYSARLTVQDNVMAGARGPAGIGLGFKDSDAVTVRRNAFVANTAGVYFDNTPRTPDQPVRFDENAVALNDVAVRLHMSREGLHFAGNDFHQNAALIEVEGGGDALSADFRGNHYSDYEGYDLDGDGAGDVPHEVKMLSSELTENRPSLKFFHGTAAMGLLDAVAHAMPVFSTRKLMVDPAPLARRPPPPAIVRAKAPGRAAKDTSR